MSFRFRESLSLIAALSAGACVTTKGGEVKTKVDTMQKEQSPEKLFDRGKAFAQIGDLTRAEQYLSEALDAGGDEKKIMPLLVIVCVNGKRYRVAIDYAEGYLKRHPDDAHLRYLVGTLYLATGDVEAARLAFEDVLKRRPDDAETHYALGVVYRDDEHDLTQADAHFRVYLNLQPQGAHVDDARASLLKSVP